MNADLDLAKQARASAGQIVTAFGKQQRGSGTAVSEILHEAADAIERLTKDNARLSAIEARAKEIGARSVAWYHSADSESRQTHTGTVHLTRIAACDKILEGTESEATLSQERDRG